jgi:hypothetical protein
MIVQKWTGGDEQCTQRDLGTPAEGCRLATHHTPRVILHGLPLEDLAQVENYLAGLTHDHLTIIAKESPDPGRTYGEIVGVINAAYGLVRWLRVDLSLSVSFRPEEWAEVQNRAAAARARLTLAEPSPDERLTEFRTVLVFVLDLAPATIERMCEGPTPDRDRKDVVESLYEMGKALDQLERAVNHRGRWPR